MKGQHGGARPGAGRKPKAQPAVAPKGEDAAPKQPYRDPLEFLRTVMNDAGADKTLRVRAAITIAQYEHVKKADGGKKDEKADAAKKAASGRFAAASGPRLATTNGRPVNGAA